MSQLDSLAAEIEAAEKKTFRKPADQQAPEPEPKAAEVKPRVEQPVEPTTPAKEPEAKPKEPQQSPPEPPKEDWEKRFKNFKSTSDATIHGLRRENLALKEELNKVETKMSSIVEKMTQMQNTHVDPFKDLFTEDERDVLGEDALKALKKANEAMVQARIKPLEEELKRTKQEQQEAKKRQLEAERKAREKDFLDRLQQLVPNCYEIDKNPKFLEFMNMSDPESGNSRVSIFNHARQIGDVRRCADFFLEFERSQRPAHNPKLERKVTPTGKAPAQPVNPRPRQKQEVLTQRDIEKFYDDVVAGKYKRRPKEQQAMEERIESQLQRHGNLRS